MHFNNIKNVMFHLGGSPGVDSADFCLPQDETDVETDDCNNVFAAWEQASSVPVFATSCFPAFKYHVTYMAEED